MATTVQLKTYEDLGQMPDDGRRYELIGGVIVMSPAPTWEHQELVYRFAELLRGHVIPQGLGRVGVAPLDVRLFSNDAVQPDVIFVRTDRTDIIVDNGTVGAPDLVVEVLSPSTRHRDLGEKLDLYAAAGIPEYWLADPIQKSFQIRVLRDGEYHVVAQVGSMVRSEILSGLEIDVDKLFADLR